MRVAGKVVVVTGGASGIGRELARAFAGQEQAGHVVVADLDGDGAAAVAEEIGGTSMRVDVGVEADLVELIERTERDVGDIDLFCSNAGIGHGKGIDESDEVWDKIWRVNTMSHIWAARHLVPRMAARGGGYLFSTASAAGLLTQIGSVTYAVTKHAAVALAEWISITHHRDGIRVTVLCPQAVRTGMTGDGPGVAGVDGMLEPDVVAQVCVDAIAEERFFALPHETVKEYMRRKATDPDRWLKGMRRLQEVYQTD
ncbi:MAG: SDR family NAD(P)-dependent oxidoreductase [Gammaproteobacteria bacterium]|nr:SDR family NAD(P)-dependent oxidoreductase [Gammaproteobacteria bacterium]